MFRHLLPKAIAALTGAMALFTLTGCTGMKTMEPGITQTVQDFGPPYKPSNVYLRTSAFPENVRRIAVLPLTITSQTTLLESGVETLEPVLYAELEKSKRFEVVPVTRQQMNAITSKPGWRIDEQLPANFFVRVKELTGCDAVLFCQLTRFQPYPPPAIGWKLNLVECQKTVPSSLDGQKAITLWSADELLDAGDPAVANGARSYYLEHLRNEIPLPDPSMVLNSPTRFGQYTVSTLLATIPERPNQLLKVAAKASVESSR